MKYIMLTFALFGMMNLDMLAFDYSKAWQDYETAFNEGRLVDAKSILNDIYSNANKDKRVEDKLRSSISLANLAISTDEKGVIQTNEILLSQMDSSSAPYKNLVAYHYASFLTQYLQNNYQAINSRTETASDSSLLTATKSYFTSEIDKAIALSISDLDKLNQDVDQFPHLVSQGDSIGKSVFKSLKYILLENAVKHYQYGSYVEANDFTNIDISLLSSYIEFRKMGKGFASISKTLELISLALNQAEVDKNNDAIAYFNLERLNYIFEHSIILEKEDRYANLLVSEAGYFQKTHFGQDYFLRAIQVHKNSGKKESLVSAKKICEQCIKSLGIEKSRGCNTELQLILQPELNLQTLTHYVPNKLIKIHLSSRNLDKVFFKILLATDYYKQSFNNIDLAKKYFSSCKVVRQWDEMIKMNAFYQNDDNTFDVAGLPIGNYVLVVSNDASFNNAYAYAPLQITNLSYLEVVPSKSGEYVIVDRTTGKPVEGATVDFYQNIHNYSKGTVSQKKIYSTKSLKDGLAKLTGIKNTSFELVVTKGKDRFDSKAGHYLNDYQRGQQSYTIAQVYTDRAIYRPGQAVYFKSIVTKYSELGIPSIMPNQSIKFDLIDANGQSVSSITKVTNAFGSCSESFVLPVGKLTGSYQIQSEFGGAEILVEEYKRPTFEVVFDTIATQYKLGDSVSISALAKTYAQASIADALVSYRISRSRIVPYCYRYYFYENYNEELITSGKTITDKDGKINLKFLAVKNPEDKIDLIYNYTVVIDVVDQTGESQSNSFSLSLSNKSKFLSSDDKQYLDLSDKLLKTFYIKNQAGLILEGKGKLTLSKLKELPLLYENNLFGNLNSHPDNLSRANYLKFDSLQVEAVINRISFTSNVSADLGKIKPGIYRIEISVDDNSASPYKEYLVVTDIKGGSLPTSSLLHYKFNKTSFKPNDELIIDLATPQKNLNVYYILSKNDKVIQQGWMELKNKAGIKYKIKEQDQGDISINLCYVYNNRFYKESSSIAVPWINNYFDIKLIDLRDKVLPGSSQQIKIKLIPKDKTDLKAEVMATMYDASLDQFRKHHFNTVSYPNSYNQFNIEGHGFNNQYANHLNYQWSNVHSENHNPLILPRLIDLIQQGYSYHGRPGRVMKSSRMESDAVMSRESAPPVTSRSAEPQPQSMQDKAEEVTNTSGTSEAKVANKAVPSIRTNLKESVFFYPHLTTDIEGNLEFSFNNNEALTKWRLMLLAHNQKMTMAYQEVFITTHKDVMIQANSPRFIRVGDELYFTARVSNLSDKSIDARADLSFVDADKNTLANLLDDQQSKSIKLAKNEIKTVSWKLKATTSLPDLVKYTVSVESGNVTDGETALLPILSNKVLVTESLPMYIRGLQTKSYQFSSLLNPSQTQQSHKYVVEVSSNPVWYAIQSMPYITGSSSNDISVTGLSNKYYINYLSKHISSSYPEIQKVYNIWQEKDRDALKSKLAKNDELKNVTLDETPWVKDALDEELQVQNIALLFDENNINNSLSETFQSLLQQKLPDGSYPWYPGGRFNYFSTKYVVSQLGHIHHLDKNDDQPLSLAKSSLTYLDEELTQQYNRLKEDTKKYGGNLDNYQPSSDLIHHLYTRSLFHQILGYRNEGFNFYYKQAVKHWNKYDLHTQAMLGYSDFYFDKRIYKEIQNSIIQRSFKSDELGLYWNVGNGYNWQELPIERHSMIMKFLNAIAVPQDQMDEMKIWLLKNKQGNKWSNTNATAAAIQSLLLTNGKKHIDLTNKQFITTKVGAFTLPDNAEISAGTSYYKKTWNKAEVQKNLANFTFINPSDNIGWGSAYYQYFEEVDKVKQSSNTSPLKIKKSLFVKEFEGKLAKLKPLDKQILKPGDILVSRIIIESDRNMEFIHLKDLRGSGCEPVNKLSQYKYSGSLGYYESTRDQATHYYIDFLPKGTHVFESSVKIVHRGSYAGGLATIQSFYAPEYSSKTEGNRIVVE